MNTKTEYKNRDLRKLGEHYTRHVMAMTTEGLHEKSAIAAELAWRDMEIARLQAEMSTMRSDLGFYYDDCK